MNHGLLVLDKPSGITSRDAVNRAQAWFPKRTRIGHTGTLDPLATGVLVLCVGQATRLAEYVQDMDKVYRTTLVFGATSDTDDADGTITPATDMNPVDEATVHGALHSFVGAIEQRPPSYSAIKLGGKRAHDLARAGEVVEITPRTVNVYSIDLLRLDWPEIDLAIHCGKGTYIRSLARDLGEKLGCGAYVKELRRMRVGPFIADTAVTLDERASEIQKRLLPPAAAVSQLPPLVLSEEQASRLAHGQSIAMPEESGVRSIYDGEEKLIAIGEIREGRLHVQKNLHGDSL